MAKAKEDALAISQQTLDDDAKKIEDYLQDLLGRLCATTGWSGKSSDR